MRRSLLLALLLLAAAAVRADSTLEAEIRQRDAELFARFNEHDLDRMMAYFDEGLEFYHDNDGLLTRAQVAEGFARLFARNDGLRRDLVPGSLHVYPVPNYGALETGRHRFCHVEHGKDDCGTFEFTILWHNTGGRWKVTRVFSYRH
ncbi:MAG TPA: nuclear transport factor 2 family protein [Thermoanaerobaculia bacterium]|jgi:ketosteroid isomerase-like protein